jgi:hypothetical protein
MSIAARAITVGLFFVFVLLSGVWLSRTGRPLNVAISTIHKLISLTMGVFLLVTVYQQNQEVPLGTAEWTAIVVTGFCFLGIVASGGFLSSDKPMPAAVLRVHQILPALAALCTATMLYFLLGR